MSRLLLIIKIVALLTLGPIAVIGSLRLELKGAILGCPYPLPFIMCNYCPVYCAFGGIRAGLFYGILGGNLLAGRAFCGFFCPGSTAQDFLFKIPVKKSYLAPWLDKGLRYLRYLLAFFVILLILESTEIWQGIPFVSGIWSVLSQQSSLVGNALIALIVLSLLFSIIVRRPFCRYLCPLGAWISPFNKYSLLELKYDTDRCTECHQCSGDCSAGIEPTSVGWNSTQCNRCLECYTGCETGAFSLRLKGRRQKD